MTTQTIWTFDNVDETMLPGLQGSCGIDGGQLVKNPTGNGRFSVSCQVAQPRAAANPAATPSSSALLSALAANPAAAAAPASFASVNPERRNAELDTLHPTVRRKAKAVQKQLDDENIPMKIFETFRSPQRQAYLYAKGRTTAGPRVTNAKPWGSHHQYGLAADFVRFENGSWNWNDRTSQQNADWDRYHEIARENGLEPLSWERPHVQLEGHGLTRLKNGDYPSGGDRSWASNLSDAIAGWSGPGAPPHPDEAPRPALGNRLTPFGATLSGSGLNWHSMFGGDEWAYDNKGVYTRNPNGTIKIWRTPGAPITVQEVLAKLGNHIRAASRKYRVAPELIVMTVATETGAFRNVGFTGPRTFRWEQAYTVNATGDPALDGREKGDYSAGPMQVLSDTARWMNNTYRLGHDNDADFTFFKNRPQPTPNELGLYDPEKCVDVGTAYIRHNMRVTGDDPLLVAAAYNAGGIYPSSANHWRIRSHGTHIDRAAEWYGDACFVLYG